MVASGPLDKEPTAGIASTHQGRDYQAQLAHAESLRNHPPSKRRPATASAGLRPKQTLQQVIERRRAEFERSVGSRRRLMAFTAPPAPPPPLAATLEDAGLGNYARKLCEDHSCATVRQLLALDATSLDTLIDAMRPLPGHRVRLLQFVRTQREKAERERDYAAQAGGGAGAARSGEPAPTAAQKREWHRAITTLRSGAAKRGTGTDVHNQQQPGWSKPSDLPEVLGHFPGRGRAPSSAKSSAYISSVRVLKCGHSRITVFDGPTPNATGRGALLGTVGLNSTFGSVVGQLGGDGVWPDTGPSWARPQELPPSSKPALTASVGRPQSAGAAASAAAGGGSRRGGGGETAPMPPKFVKPPPDEVQAPTPSSSACASAEPKPKPEPEPAAPATVVAAPEGEFSFDDMVRQSGGASVA